jgi:hypothetical protein
VPDPIVSSGVYALIGVVAGGGVTAAVQIGVGVFMARRAEKAEWRVAARLVSEELDRLLLDLENLIERGTTPLIPIDERYLSTTLWEDQRAVIARELPDSKEGDKFWRGLAGINSATSHKLRLLFESKPPGTPLDPSVIEVLRDGFEAASAAYVALTGKQPHAKRPALGSNDATE